jgi:hypothetical protein
MKTKYWIVNVRPEFQAESPNGNLGPYFFSNQRAIYTWLNSWSLTESMVVVEPVPE